MGRPKLRVLPGYRPHDAVILGLDPATRSGWAVFSMGRLRFSGTCENAHERLSILELASKVSLEEEVPLVIVAEDWSVGGWKSWEAIAKTYEAWGRWAEAIELHDLAPWTVRVKVNDWRHDLYGNVKRMDRKTAKMLAKQRVLSVYKKQVTDDEAEAVLIGEWGCRASEVAAILTA